MFVVLVQDTAVANVWIISGRANRRFGLYYGGKIRCGVPPVGRHFAVVITCSVASFGTRRLHFLLA